jgi:hypothetical protein
MGVSLKWWIPKSPRASIAKWTNLDDSGAPLSGNHGKPWFFKATPEKMEE